MSTSSSVAGSLYCLCCSGLTSGLQVNTLIITDVHARDLVERFQQDGVADARDFAWESQLRFYWDRTSDGVAIRQCNGARFHLCSL